MTLNIKYVNYEISASGLRKTEIVKTLIVKNVFIKVYAICGGC